MIKNWKATIAGIAAILVGTTVGSVHASGIEKRGTVPPKHDSNSLHKLGNAIQYPFRKAGENISVGTHRTTQQNSVVKDQKHGSTEVVNPNGKTVVIAKDNKRLGWTDRSHSGYYMHRRHNFNQEGRRYYWFNGHRYYLDLKTGNRVMID